MLNYGGARVRPKASKPFNGRNPRIPVETGKRKDVAAATDQLMRPAAKDAADHASWPLSEIRCIVLGRILLGRFLGIRMQVVQNRFDALCKGDTLFVLVESPLIFAIEE